MFKSIHVPFSGLGGRNTEYQNIANFRNQNTKIHTSKQNSNTHFIKYSLMYVGRWILTPHQKRAIDFFLRKGRRMILGDGWNMGKTVTSLACMHYSKSRKVLILTN